MVAAADSTRAALSVHTSGRKRPVASAKPATRPLGSSLGAEWTAKTVPLVPIDTTTSPGLAPSPSAVAMLSPVPAATTAPVRVSPATALGSSTRGSAGTRPKASSSRSSR
jgi:hypothetical protein